MAKKQQPKKQNTVIKTAQRATFLTGCLVGLGCLAIIALFVAVPLLLTGPVNSLSDSFMGALRDNNTNAAYAMLSPQLQAQRTLANFQASLPAGGLTSWDFSNRSLAGSSGEARGTAVFGGQNYTFRLNMADVNGAWRVTAYTFTRS